MTAHHHVTEEWKGLRARTVGTLSEHAAALALFDESVRVLRDVIGLTPRQPGATGTMRTQILDSPTDSWVTVRTWSCEGTACSLDYHRPTPPTDRPDWYAGALNGRTP